MELHRLVNYGLLTLAFFYATLRGGLPERIVAGLLVVATILSPLVQTRTTGNFRSVEWGLVGVDLGLLALLLWLALVSARFWPMLVVALHGASMIAHAAAPLATHGSDRAYAMTEIAPSFLNPVLLVWATSRHRRRLRRYGSDPAWTRDLPTEYLEGGSAHVRADA